VASAYALGSVASQQRELGNKAQAEALNATLVDTLEEASAPEEKAVMLRAMGNAAMPENVDTLAEYTRHASSDVRAAAATALRDTHTETSMQALLELLKDPEWPVQQAALATLSGYTLTAAEAQQVEDLVVSGVVGSRNDPLLVTVLARNATPEHPLLASLGHVLARNQQNGQLAARIRSVARRNGVTL
jgi:HEAT repeat protein